MDTATVPIDIFGLTRGSFVEAARDRLPSGAGLAGKIYLRTFSEGVFGPDGFGLAPETEAAWRRHFTANFLELEATAEEEGQFGVTRKLVFRAGDGHRIECVHIPMPNGFVEPGPDRATLCVSSQVGCGMACAFCETGGMGLIRDLRAAEIVSQVMTARHRLGLKFNNLVFMGMGEPLDNADNLIRAIEILNDQGGLRLGLDRMTVCTSGQAEGIRRLAAKGWKRLNISFSLNSAEGGTRDSLMPINRRFPLEDVAAAFRDYPKRKNFILGINYCLIPGLNDSARDAELVAEFCRPLGRCLVNIIPYNPGSHPVSRPPKEEEIGRFSALLEAKGLPLRRRATKGRSIMAGCGQLGKNRE
jgi:23S rRNA (adenine2503-C2)-methyltransferase